MESNADLGNSLVVQRLGPCALLGPDSISGQEPRSHKLHSMAKKEKKKKEEEENKCRPKDQNHAPDHYTITTHPPISEIKKPSSTSIPITKFSFYFPKRT